MRAALLRTAARVGAATATRVGEMVGDPVTGGGVRESLAIRPELYAAVAAADDAVEEEPLSRLVLVRNSGVEGEVERSLGRSVSSQVTGCRRSTRSSSLLSPLNQYFPSTVPVATKRYILSARVS